LFLFLQELTKTTKNKKIKRLKPLFFKDKTWEWTHTCASAFNTIKDAGGVSPVEVSGQWRPLAGFLIGSGLAHFLLFTVSRNPARKKKKTNESVT